MPIKISGIFFRSYRNGYSLGAVRRVSKFFYYVSFLQIRVYFLRSVTDWIYERLTIVWKTFSDTEKLIVCANLVLMCSTGHSSRALSRQNFLCFHLIFDMYLDFLQKQKVILIQDLLFLLFYFALFVLLFLLVFTVTMHAVFRGAAMAIKKLPNWRSGGWWTDANTLHLHLNATSLTAWLSPWIAPKFGC